MKVLKAVFEGKDTRKLEAELIRFGLTDIVFTEVKGIICPNCQSTPPNKECMRCREDEE
ncbi:MAG: hypothetical protein KKB59_19435 [Spirochaetes bacterium]|nr:hypothetical protein [Spirochaetota bacterium]